MASKRILMAALLALAAMLFFITVNDADDSDAFLVPMGPHPPVFVEDPPEADEEIKECDCPEILPVIFDHRVVPTDIMPFPPAPESETDEPEGPPQVPMPSEQMPLPDKVVFHKVIRIDYESLLNLSLLRNSMCLVNTKDEDEEEAEETQLVIVEVTDDEASEVPTTFPEPEPVYMPIVLPEIVLFSAGDAVGPIFIEVV